MKASWTTNLLLKGVAVLLAVFLWNYYRSEDQAIRFVTVPLQFDNLPANRELSGEIPAAVTVQLEAPEAMARSLTPDWVTAQIDLAEVGLGDQRVRLGAEQIRAPAGARVLGITPDLVSLSVERKIQKIVPIEPRTQGEPAAGFELGRISLLPAQATLEGPESEVARATRALTEWIAVGGRTQTFQEGVAVIPPEGSRARVVGPRSAIAKVEVGEVGALAAGEPAAPPGP